MYLITLLSAFLLKHVIQMGHLGLTGRPDLADPFS